MNKFDELTKAMAQSVNRRQAIRRFGIGLAGMALGCFGLANKANAIGNGCNNNSCMYRCMAQYESQGVPKKQAKSQCVFYCCPI
jgi:hypothetical protein